MIRGLQLILGLVFTTQAPPIRSNCYNIPAIAILVAMPSTHSHPHSKSKPSHSHFYPYFNSTPPHSNSKSNSHSQSYAYSHSYSHPHSYWHINTHTPTSTLILPNPHSCSRSHSHPHLRALGSSRTPCPVVPTVPVPVLHQAIAGLHGPCVPVQRATFAQHHCCTANLYALAHRAGIDPLAFVSPCLGALLNY